MDSLNLEINKLPNIFQMDIPSLEDIQRSHPASAIARMALLKQYRKANNPLYDKLKEESALYAGNFPQYLFVLSQIENGTDPFSEEISAEEPTTAVEEDIVPPEADSQAAETADSLSFDPLHTIDYFASQGIKLREEDLKEDQLSQQVRSFTGWLKSMKQLHPGRLPKQDEVIEKIIQDASDASNVASEVLTEAMAEVLVKQSKKEKAIEMYEKLSLMNPAKSVYFAAKIENLKTT